MTHVITFPKLGWEFTVNTVAFSIGSFHVYWYGIIIAVGFLLALAYASVSCKKMNIDVNRLFDVVIVGLIAGVIFARLFYVVFYPGDKYLKNPMEIFQIHDGGIWKFDGKGTQAEGCCRAGYCFPGFPDWTGCRSLGQFYQPRSLWLCHGSALGHAQ